MLVVLSLHLQHPLSLQGLLFLAKRYVLVSLALCIQLALSLLVNLLGHF